MGHVCRNRYRGVAWNEVAEDVGAFRGCTTREAEGRRGKETHCFVEAGAEVRKVFDFIVGSDDFIGVEDRVDFGSKMGKCCRVLEEHVHSIVHGYGGGIGAGVHWKCQSLAGT